MAKKKTLKKKKINEKLFIELYNLGKNDYEISKLLKIGERTASRLAQRLREKGKLKLRKTNQIEDKLGFVGLENLDEEKLRKLAVSQWKVPKGIRKNKTNEKFKIYLYTADQHVPDHSIPANRAVHKLMDDIKFDGFRIVGDFQDLGSISHWNEHRRLTLETQRIKKDYIVGNTLLDEYDKRLPENCDKGFFWGNHEAWHDILIEKLPVLEGMLNPTTELHLKERGYKVYEKLNHIEKIGRLSVTHGVYANVHAVKKHIDEFKTNVLFFHTHSIGSRSSNSPAKEIAIVGYNGGCLCDKNPDYLKNRPNKWSHGFTIVYYMPNGYFFVDNIRIVKGRFIYNNKLYDGNV